MLMLHALIPKPARLFCAAGQFGQGLALRIITDAHFLPGNQPDPAAQRFDQRLLGGKNARGAFERSADISPFARSENAREEPLQDLWVQFPEARNLNQVDPAEQLFGSWDIRSRTRAGDHQPVRVQVLLRGFQYLLRCNGAHLFGVMLVIIQA